MKRKKARTANDPELDKALFRFVKERQAGAPVSGPVLSVQAQKFRNNLHEDLGLFQFPHIRSTGESKVFLTEIYMEAILLSQ